MRILIPSIATVSHLCVCAAGDLKEINIITTFAWIKTFDSAIHIVSSPGKKISLKKLFQVMLLVYSIQEISRSGIHSLKEKVSISQAFHLFPRKFLKKW